MNHKKSRLTDLFRKMDKDNNGLIPRDDFIEGIMKTSSYLLLFLFVTSIHVLINCVIRIRHLSFGNERCSRLIRSQ